MSNPPDYLANREVEEGDKVDYGIKGQKWGIRRTKAQLQAADSKGTSEDKPKTPPANESASQKYDRLKSEAKAGRSSQLSDEDLRWFNARTDALTRINKLNQRDPNWLKNTTKQVLRDVAKETMKSVVTGAAKQYISNPLVDSLNSKK